MYLALRRNPPGPGLDAARHCPRRAPTSGFRLSRLGTQPCRSRSDDLEQSSGASSGLGRLDPGRDRGLAPRSSAGELVPGGGPCERSMGARRVGLRRGVRFDLGSRAQLALRRARCRSLLRGGRGTHCLSGTHLVQPPPGAGDPSSKRPFLHRHGGAPGLARPGLLAGPARSTRHCRLAHLDVAGHGANASAWFSLLCGVGLCFL